MKDHRRQQSFQKSHPYSPREVATTEAGVTETLQARLSIHSAMTPKVPERTQRQRVSENTPHLHVLANQQVSGFTALNVLEGTQKASEKPIQETCPVTLAEPTQYTILGLPIVHLSVALENPPWIQLSQRGILPKVETICQTTQTFAGRISLFRSNWKALTQELWVIQTVLEGYHISLLSAPLQHASLTCPQRMQQYWRRRYSPSRRSRP